MITGLQGVLTHLSPIEQISISDRTKIKKIIDAYHQQYGNYLGKGNGVEITKAIDTYMENFFNAYLKNIPSPLFGCTPLTNNSYLKCGPGIF